MLLEHQAKELLAQAGLPVPTGLVATNAAEAADAASQLDGRVVLKAQAPVGGRGKAGAILHATDPKEAELMANQLLGSEVSGFLVGSLLVEQRVDIDHELYAAVINDPDSKGPLVLLSTEGGVDIEELHAPASERIQRQRVDIRQGLTPAEAGEMAGRTHLPRPLREELASFLVGLYGLYRRVDAKLVEVNPLAVTTAGKLLSLDCKMDLDPGALARHPLLQQLQRDVPMGGTPLEQKAAVQGLLYIELDGKVGILANGAGLTMATLDAVAHHGGRPANFLEIGGDAYIKAEAALELVLSNPNVKSLLVNFCGAFARTDIMVEGVVEAIETIRPSVAISFSIHGTGEKEAIRLVRERLSINPHHLMDDAVREAVAAAGRKAEQ